MYPRAKTSAGFDEAGGVGGETASRREPGCHFAQRAHDGVDEETDESVSDEDGRRGQPEQEQSRFR